MLPLLLGPKNLFPIESAVFDEDFRDSVACDHAPCYVDTRHRGFERVGIQLRAPRFGIERDAEALEQRVVGMKADERIDAIGPNALLVTECTAHQHVALGDLDDLGSEARLDF